MKKLILASSLLTVFLSVSGCISITVDEDLFADARVLTKTEECSMVQVPIYGVVDRPASSTEVAAGAVVGGAIGNQVGKGNGRKAMTVLGAIVGSSAGAQRKTERVITGYEEKRQCRTVYK